MKTNKERNKKEISFEEYNKQINKRIMKGQTINNAIFNANKLYKIKEMYD